MSIVTLPLPYQIQDGQLADAVPVMGNFNYIASQINASVAVTPLVWTPKISIGGSFTGITYAHQAGLYMTIGGIVFVMGNIQLSSKGVGAGSVYLENLPVFVNTSADCDAAGSVSLGGGGAFTFSWLTLQPTATLNSAAFITNKASTARAELQASDITNTSTFGFSMFYPS